MLSLLTDEQVNLHYRWTESAVVWRSDSLQWSSTDDQVPATRRLYSWSAPMAITLVVATRTLACDSARNSSHESQHVYRVTLWDRKVPRLYYWPYLRQTPTAFNPFLPRVSNWGQWWTRCDARLANTLLVFDFPALWLSAQLQSAGKWS